MPAVTIRLTGELRPARGDGRRGAGSGFRRQRPSTPTVVSGWERLAAVRLRSAAIAAPAVADAPSAPVAAPAFQQVARTRQRPSTETAGRCARAVNLSGSPAGSVSNAGPIAEGQRPRTPWLRPTSLHPRQRRLL